MLVVRLTSPATRLATQPLAGSLDADGHDGARDDDALARSGGEDLGVDHRTAPGVTVTGPPPGPIARASVAGRRSPPTAGQGSRRHRGRQPRQGCLSSRQVGLRQDHGWRDHIVDDANHAPQHGQHGRLRDNEGHELRVEWQGQGQQQRQGQQLRERLRPVSTEERTRGPQRRGLLGAPSLRRAGHGFPQRCGKVRRRGAAPDASRLGSVKA